MEEFKGTKKVCPVEYAGTIFMNVAPYYEAFNADQAGETAYCKALVAVNLVKSRHEALEGYGVKTSEGG